MTSIKALIGTAAGILALGAMIGFTGTAAKPVAEVGQKAPEFALKDVNGAEVKLADVLAKEDTKAVVLEWFNPGCPWVKAHYNADKSAKVIEQFDGQGVVWLRINSGGAGKQGAGVEANKAAADQWQITEPILLDESGEVGKAYGAKTTPHMFVLDGDGVVRYMGAFDDIRRPGAESETPYVADALKAVLAGETIETTKTKSYGCRVHYAN